MNERRSDASSSACADLNRSELPENIFYAYEFMISNSSGLYQRFKIYQIIVHLGLEYWTASFVFQPKAKA